MIAERRNLSSGSSDGELEMKREQSLAAHSSRRSHALAAVEQLVRQIDSAHSSKYISKLASITFSLLSTPKRAVCFGCIRQNRSHAASACAPATPCTYLSLDCSKCQSDASMQTISDFKFSSSN